MQNLRGCHINIFRDLMKSKIQSKGYKVSDNRLFEASSQLENLVFDDLNLGDVACTPNHLERT